MTGALVTFLKSHFQHCCIWKIFTVTVLKYIIITYMIALLFYLRGENILGDS